MIEVNSLTKKYGSNLAVNDVKRDVAGTDPFGSVLKRHSRDTSTYYLREFLYCFISCTVFSGAPQLPKERVGSVYKP